MLSLIFNIWTGKMPIRGYNKSFVLYLDDKKSKFQLKINSSKLLNFENFKILKFHILNRNFDFDFKEN